MLRRIAAASMRCPSVMTKQSDALSESCMLATHRAVFRLNYLDGECLNPRQMMKKP